ncbi:MAG TPA: hypothetical protein VFN41_03070, partial [Candidatus Limnocylindrales bacterium]|nr:hypothetical protein [Candidatus Limnocylindrales bacterium]
MRHTRHALLVLVVLATGLAAPTGSLAADPSSPAPTRDDILVRFRPNTSPTARKAVARDRNLSLVRESRSGRTAILRGKGISPATVRRELASDPRISAVGQNYRREIAADPTSEQYFKSEWGLNNTGQTISGIEPQTGVPDVDIDG